MNPGIAVHVIDLFWYPRWSPWQPSWNSLVKQHLVQDNSTEFEPKLGRGLWWSAGQHADSELLRVSYLDIQYDHLGNDFETLQTVISSRPICLIVLKLACTDPGIFVRGVQAQRPENSVDNVFFGGFLVLSLFYSLQKGSNGCPMVLMWWKLFFPKDPEGVQHFRGGSKFFQGGPKANF